MSLTPLAALERRRTIRNYDPNWQIPKDQMDKIMNAAQLSPTACNFQGQDYIVVTNKEKLAKLEKIIIDSLPEDNFKKHFVERKERHGVNNVVTSMCLGVVAMKCTQDKCEELFGLKKGSLLLGVALGKPKGELKLHEKDIKSKVSYVE